MKKYEFAGRIFEISDGAPVYENPYLKLINYSTRTDGCDGLYSVVERKDAVAIILESPTREILLLEQFRYPARKVFLELLMGTANPQESPLETALRETYEEAGVQEIKLEHIGRYYPLPGLSPQVCHVFRGRLSPEQVHAATNYSQPEDEILSRRFVSLEDLRSLIKTGAFQEGVSLASLAIYFNQ